MTRFARGGALIETALVIGIVLTVLFGTLQLGALGFVQMASDGAAFVSARTYAQTTSSGTAFAKTVATGVFAKVPASAITLTPGTSTVASAVTSTSAGVPVPGAPATVTLRSQATERVPAAAGATPGAFAASGTLANYRTGSGYAYPSYTFFVAQTFGTGNGHNGRFAEWYCRQKVYSGVSFPSRRPWGGSGSSWDPIACQFIFQQIYSWDDGQTTCA